MGSMGVLDGVLMKAFARPEGAVGRVGGWVMARGNGATEKYLVGMAGLHGKEQVVVLGPGPGIGLRAAAQYAGVVVGVDPSEEMLLVAKRRCRELVERGKVELIHGDAANTHRPDRSASVVLSVNNVQLWPDRVAGLTEIRRILKPGGRVLISVHARWAPEGLAEEVRAAGFQEVVSKTWQPPTRTAGRALIVKAHTSSSAI
jgi:arsenite methyltransferase